MDQHTITTGMGTFSPRIFNSHPIFQLGDVRDTRCLFSCIGFLFLLQEGFITFNLFFGAPFLLWG
jgi:hypothetical protein